MRLFPRKLTFLAALYGTKRPFENDGIGVSGSVIATTSSQPVPPGSWTGYDATRIKVFIYDVPELDHGDLIQCWKQRNGGESPWQAQHHDVARNMAEVWLHEALLAHPWRVQYPSQADLFYIPLYPALSYQVSLLATSPGEETCGGWSHEERMETALDFLTRKSLFFNRFGGADHMLACTHHETRKIFDSSHRMVLRRVILGVHRRTLERTMWGCGLEKLVGLPYVAHSELTATIRVGGRPYAERDVPLLFVGSSQHQTAERLSLQVRLKAQLHNHRVCMQTM